MSDCLWNHFKCKAWSTTLWVYILLPKAVEMPGQHIQNGLGLGLFPYLGIWFGVSEKSLIRRVDMCTYQLDMCSKRSCIFINVVCVPMRWVPWAGDSRFCCECPQSHWMESKSQIPNPVFWWEVSSGVLSHLAIVVSSSDSCRSRPQLLPFRRNSIIHLSILRGS